MKISSPGSLNNHPPKEITKIQLSQNLTKSFQITRFCETNPTVKYVLSFEMERIFQAFLNHYDNFIIFAIFQENQNFPEFYILDSKIRKYF